jgi:hypothetical membrane protein
VVGGIVGPAAFVTAWLIGGARQPDYSPVTGHISRLAASGSPNRVLMTAGFLAFGAGVAPFAAGTLRRWVDGPAWMAIAGAALGTVGVAATPLDAGIDGLHAVAATSAYAALAAGPLLASRSLRRAGRVGWARASMAAGLATGAALAASVADLSPGPGLWQRTGVGIGDVWIAAVAVDVLRHRQPPLGVRPLG